jgi:hypothetical protein
VELFTTISYSAKYWLIIIFKKNPMQTTIEKQVKNVAHKIAAQPERKEGQVATLIEKQTSKIPSDAFLWTAFGLMAVSLGLQVAGKKHISQFIGEWPIAFLIMGLYNKVVKVAGHDKYSRG